MHALNVRHGLHEGRAQAVKVKLEDVSKKEAVNDAMRCYAVRCYAVLCHDDTLSNLAHFNACLVFHPGIKWNELIKIQSNSWKVSQKFKS